MRYDQKSHKDALLSIAKRISSSFPSLPQPVEAYICGGSAVMYWIRDSRISLDVDMFFSRKVLIPRELSASFLDQDGLPVDLEFDYNFNEMFSLLQADYAARAITLMEFSNLRVNVISPVDLAVMKLYRFSGQDQDDIRSLIENGLLNDNDTFKAVAEDAMKDYIGDLRQIALSVDMVSGWIEKHRQQENGV